MDPVLEQQAIMNGGPSSSAAPPSEAEFGITSVSPSSTESERQVSLFIAAAAVASVLVLAGLRTAGIRFSFGANVGGGA